MDTLLTILVSAIVPIAVASIPALITLSQVKLSLKQSREDAKKDLHDQIQDTLKVRCDNEDEGLQCLLRDSMLKMYFRHIDNNNLTLRQYEAEDIHRMYNTYKKLEGNSFVDEIYEIMMTWKIVQN